MRAPACRLCILIGDLQINDGGLHGGKAYLISGDSLGTTSTIDLSQAEIFFCGNHMINIWDVGVLSILPVMSRILSHFVRKPNPHQNCVTNTMYTRIPMAIMDCEELALNRGYERF